MPAKVKFFDGTHNFTLNYPKESGNETENLRYPRKKRNMKTNFFSLQLILVLLLCLGGCTLDTLLPTIQTTYIRGGKINGFHPSSRNSTPQSLPVGSQITFYSQGGLTAEGTLLTYNGSYWEGDIDLTWNTEHSQAQTCAFYPPILSQSLLHLPGRETPRLTLFPKRLPSRRRNTPFVQPSICPSDFSSIAQS